MATTLDAVDQEILAKRVALREQIEGPRVGDYVQFADRDRPVRRIAHRWEDGAQTTDGGSFHLSAGGGSSFSGGLWPSVPYTTLTLTDDPLEGSFWFFSHDYPTAGGGVTVYIPCRVYLCSRPTNHYGS